MDRFSESFNYEIINAIADPVYVKNDRHEWVYLNKPALSFLQIDGQDYMGKNEYDFFPKEVAESLFIHDKKILEDGKTAAIELQMHRNDQLYYLAFQASVFESGMGRFLVCTVRDVTQRKIAEEESNERERRFRLLANYIQSGVITCDVEERISYMNQMAMDFSGVNQKQAVNTSVYEILNFSNNFKERLKIQKENPESRVIESCDGEVKHASGILTPVQIHITPVFEDGKFQEMLIIFKEREV